MMAGTSSYRLTGRQVLFILFGFFGLMLVANLTMVYFAMDSWTGLTAKKSYAQGIQYNSTLADAERQRALGWTLHVAGQHTGNGAVFRMTLEDRSGAPLRGHRVEAVLQRPTHENEDHKVVFTQQNDGTYVANMDDVGQGNWKMFIQFYNGNGDRQFYREERLWLK